MMRSRIAGTGMYVPPRVYKNDDLKEFMETSDEWITQRTGIKQRHWVDDWSVGNSDLGLPAAETAIKNAGLDKKDIDCIIYGTLSPDHEFPGTACFLQKKLGLPGVPAIDVRQQCSGFIYMLSIADSFIQTGQFKRVLIVGSEVHSKGVEKADRGRDVAVLFGDGAGAVVVEAVDVKNPKTESFVFSTHLHADGQFADELWIEAPGMGCGAKERLVADMVRDEDARRYPKMNGKLVFMHASKRMPEVLMEAMTANEYRLEDVDLFLFHQANLRINEMVAKQLKIPEDKVFNTIQKYANTTNASIPIGMDEAIREGKLKRGMLVAGAAFGSGFTWASFLMRY